MTNPVLVEVTRGPLVESRHRAAAAVSLASGETVLAIGDVGAAVYPRSAIKPMQAMALIAAEGSESLRLGGDQVALICASHSGEPEHLAGVRTLLSRFGLSEADLECGPQWPANREAANALVRAGVGASALANNCSGKHAGMLALAKLLGAATRGYVDPSHPVQRRVAALLEAMLGHAVDTAPCGVDGCSVPTWAVPLGALARGFARLVSPAGLAPRIARAAGIVAGAMAGAPFMVAGTGRFCTEIMAAPGTRAVVKTGAEGVMCAGLPGRGLGIAVKCDDGAGRAAETLMAHLLVAFGAADAEAAVLRHYLTRPLRNAAGRHIGDVRASVALSDALAAGRASMIA